jgi:hypothetical protein
MQLLDTAESAVQSGHAPSDLTILITSEGGIQMVADSDWPLESLQLHHGARMAYRVSQSAAHVRVEGRAGTRTCLFETEKPERAARFLLQRSPAYWTQAPKLLEASQPSVA